MNILYILYIYIVFLYIYIYNIYIACIYIIYLIGIYMYICNSTMRHLRFSYISIVTNLRTDNETKSVKTIYN